MKTNKSVLYLLIAFIFYYVMYVFLIPANENPDESRHIRSVFYHEDVFNIKGNGDLYFAFQEKIANIFNLEYTQKYRRDNVIKRQNSEFKYFSNDYRYTHDTIFPHHDLVIFRLANLVVLLPLFFWFLQKRSNRFLFVLALCFPGFVWFLTCLNPDLFNIAFGVVLFNMRNKSRWLLFIMLFLAYLALDRSIILLVLTYVIFFIYERFFKKKLLKYLFWSALLLSLFIFYDLSKNVISLEYEYEPIKSIFTAIFSFYGLVGNMSIRSTFLEYILIISLFLGLTIKMQLDKKKNTFSSEAKSFGSMITIFFVLWCYLLTLVPTLDQGRYFYPIIFYLMFLVKEVVIKDRIKRLNSILTISFAINGLMFFKLIYVFLKQ